MASTVDFRKRIETLAAVIRPARSVAARVEELPDADRQLYRRWRLACVDWHQKFNRSDAAYQAYLDGESFPELPYRLEIAIFGLPVEVLKTETLADAAEKWRQAMEKRS